jgi:hypothetical protein
MRIAGGSTIVCIAVMAAVALMVAGCGSPDDGRAFSSDEPTVARSAASTAPRLDDVTATVTSEPAASPTTALSDGAPSATLTPFPPNLPTPLPTRTPRPMPAPESITGATLPFEVLPGPEWALVKSLPFHSPMSVAGGILTIDSPNGGDLYSMPVDRAQSYTTDPPDVWSRHVDNARGWWVEARFRVDPITPATCASIEDQGGVGMSAGDFNREVRVFVGPTSMCLLTLQYPQTQMVTVPIDSTSAFHLYRVELKRDTVRVYVDGAVVIDYVIPADIQHGSDPHIRFGNFNELEPMRSYWDYVSFDVRGIVP